MCPVLNLQCQLTTNYFNLEFLSDFFFIISILLIYVYCCVFCYNRYFALCKSGDLFVYTENIYTRNLFTKSSRIFFFSWWSHASSITYICIVPGLCKSVGMHVILVEGQAIQEKKIDLQASIFLEYLILSKVGEIFLKAFIRVRNCVENFFFILQQKMMYMNIALHQVEKSMVMTWMFHLMTIYTNVNYFSIPLVIFDRYKQEEIF